MRTRSPTMPAPQRRNPWIRGLLLAMAAALGAGCLYRMPIQQGNFLDENQVNQLEPGMTRSQVSFLLGTPMVPNGFNADRWDYYYFIKVGRTAKGTDTKRLTVWFKDDKVDHVDRSNAPPGNKVPLSAAEEKPDAKIPPAETPPTAD